MYESIIALNRNCIFNNISTTILEDVIIIVTLSTILSSDKHDPQHLDWSQHHFFSSDNPDPQHLDRSQHHLLPLLGADQLFQHGARPAQYLSGEH